MRKKIVGLVLLAMAATTLTAQEQDRDRIQDQDRTKLVVVNGEMLQVRERAEIHVRERVTLSDGTVLQPNGAYETPDGKRYRLKDGECLDGDGIMYRNEYQYRHKIQQENAGLNPQQVRERNQNRVQYAFMDGNLYQIRNQEQHRLETAMRLENGATAFPDGSYQLQNQNRIRLENGQCISIQGDMFRNMYQMRKQMMQRRQLPNKQLMKKPSTGPMANTKRKST